METVIRAKTFTLSDVAAAAQSMPKTSDEWQTIALDIGFQKPITSGPELLREILLLPDESRDLVSVTHWCAVLQSIAAGADHLDAVDPSLTSEIAPCFPAISNRIATLIRKHGKPAFDRALLTKDLKS
jgi:hypothetical protein